MAASSAPPVSPVFSWDKTTQIPRQSPKKNNALIPVICGLIVLLLGIGIWRVTHSAGQVAWVKVVASSKDLTPGSHLGYTTLRYIDFPKQFLTSDMVPSLNSVAGHVTRTFIPAGEPITRHMLFPGHDNLSSSLRYDERAITLQLTDDELVDHSIAPEDRVDVLVVSTKGKNKYTKTLCQNARVLLSAPQEQLFARRSNGNAGRITLAVNPSSAEAISEAAEVGKIRLVLRNSDNSSQEVLSGAGTKDLLPTVALNESQAEPYRAVSVPPPSILATATNLPGPPKEPLEWMVEVISGSHKENYGVPRE